MGDDFNAAGSPGQEGGYDTLMDSMGFVDPYKQDGTPRDFQPESVEQLRARLLDPNYGLVTPSASAPPTPIQTGAASLPEVGPSVPTTSAAAAPASAPSGGGASAARRMPSAEARASVMAQFGNRLPGGGPGAWRNDPLFNQTSNAEIRDNSESFTAAETLERQRARAAAEEQARIDAMGTNAPGYNLDYGDPTGRSRKADLGFGQEESGGSGPRGGSFARSQRAQMVGTALGGAAQLLNTGASMRAVRNQEGPVDNPFQRVQMMDTDLQTGAAVQQIKDAEARQAAMLSGNVSNPAVRAAMLRASQRASQEKIGSITANEAAQEQQMRNQNLMQVNQTLNQNRMIGAQNRQRQIDFSNDQQAALNRLRNQGAQQLGGMASDFMRTQADTQRMKYIREAYDPYGLGASDDERNS